MNAEDRVTSILVERDAIVKQYVAECEAIYLERDRLEQELKVSKLRAADYEAALRWMLNYQATTVFIEEEEHVADFFKRAREAIARWSTEEA